MHPRFFNPNRPQFNQPPRNFPSQQNFQPQQNFPSQQNFQAQQMPQFQNNFPGNFNDNQGMIGQNYPPPRQETHSQDFGFKQRSLNLPNAPKFSEHHPTRDELRDRRKRHEQNKNAETYKFRVTRCVQALEEKFRKHMNDPESHPFYKKEWKLFWNRKADELKKRGEDPADYDFHDEWCHYFIERLRELHDQEVKFRVGKLKRKFKQAASDYPVIKKAKNINCNEIPTFMSNQQQAIDDKSDDDKSEDDDGYENFHDDQPSNSANFTNSIDQMPTWKMQQSPAHAETTPRARPSRFDQPPASMTELEHPKFQTLVIPHPPKAPITAFPPFPIQKPPPPVISGISVSTSGFENIPTAPTAIAAPRFNHHEAFAALKKGKGNEDLTDFMNSTIKLENVPISMKIPVILDFFASKFRGIVGCFRSCDYITKIPSKTVYMILMNDKEIEAFQKMKEIIMNGCYVKITTVKLLTGSCLIDPTAPEVPGASPSLFINGLEKRTIESTFYLRELAKIFDAQSTLTGIRLCHLSKQQKTRSFGFAHFMSKASVDEYEGRVAKMYDYEIRTSRTEKIPIMVHAEHSNALSSNPLYWNNHLRTIDVLSVDMQ